ncbi:MAG: hypothetical protein BGO76_07215 [Caedibacter sp. 38-128]|nr:MAG: hypothetical protein BGO76_07215 [Caedibacter sp. 38-128]
MSCLLLVAKSLSILTDATNQTFKNHLERLLMFYDLIIKTYVSFCQVLKNYLSIFFMLRINVWRT